MSSVPDARRTKLDQVVDDALREMVAGEPQPSLRSRVLARVAHELPGERARVGWRGWVARPRFAPASALAGAALVAVAAAALWTLAGPGRDQVGRVVPGREVASSTAPAESAQARVATPPAERPPATTRGVEGSASARVGAPRSATVARGGGEPAYEAPAGRDDPSQVSFPPLRLDPIAEPEEMAVAPIELNEIALEEIQIEPIEVVPLDRGGTSPAGREGRVEERR